ncbi:MAG: potassium channel family protein [Armatimonadetes bacterium]|nr:potassium channel family protein [Armatimonadota bacterium]
MRLSTRSRPRFGVLQQRETSPVPSLLRRVGLAVGLIVAISFLLWFNRAGLQDNTHPDRPLGFTDVFYFTVVTLTTVGYGDIIPVTPEARLVNAILLTPIRVFLWVLFLGTAYELILERYRERVQLEQLQKRMKNHAIICGYGVKGRSIIEEMLAHGHSSESIVVIDPDEAASKEAAAHGLIALHGDASTEAILRAAVIEKADHVLVAPNRDDACVLICLTVRSLAPKVRLIASAREEENIKLIYSAGADVVIAPSVSGGRLMAAAVRQKAVTQFLEDLLAFGKGIDAGERVVRQEESGLHPRDLPDLEGALVLGVARDDEYCPFHQMRTYRLQPGDVVVYLTGSPECAPMEPMSNGPDPSI